MHHGVRRCLSRPPLPPMHASCASGPEPFFGRCAIADASPRANWPREPHAATPPGAATNKGASTSPELWKRPSRLGCMFPRATSAMQAGVSTRNSFSRLGPQLGGSGWRNPGCRRSESLAPPKRNRRLPFWKASGPIAGTSPGGGTAAGVPVNGRPVPNSPEWWSTVAGERNRRRIEDGPSRKMPPRGCAHCR